VELPKALRLINGYFEVFTGGYPVKPAFAATGGSVTKEIVAAVAGKKIRVLAYRLQARSTNPAAGSIHFHDGLSQRSQAWDLNPREGCAVQSGDALFEFETAAGQPLNTVQTDAAHAYNVTVLYIEV
jgi:hypothetical protein